MPNLKKLSKKTQQALSLFQQKDFAGAKPLLLQVCQKDSRFDLAGFLLASIYFIEHDLASAQKYYQYTVHANPNHWEAHNNLGVTYERLGNNAEAMRYYKKAISVKPGYAKAYFHLANLLNADNETDAAITNYRLALKSTPDHFPSLNNLAYILVKRNQYDEALQLLQRAENIQADDLEVLTNLGVLLRKREDYPASIDKLSRALIINPNFGPAYEQLAISYHYNGDFDLALRNFKTAIDLNPNNDTLRTCYGDLLNDKGDYETAKIEFETAISLNEANEKSWNGLAAAEKLAGNIDKAIDIFSNAFQQFPSNLNIQFNLATSYLAIGDYPNGWKNYSARPSYLEHGGNTHKAQLPLDLSEKSIFIEYEQGIGDELFFLRYVPELKKRGAKVVYFPHKNSRKLIVQLRILDEIVESRKNAAKSDYHILVGDLPFCLSNAANIEPPPSIPLCPSTQWADEAMQALNKLGPPPYIALSWRAGQTLKHQLYKEIPIKKLAEIIKSVQATFIAIQRNPLKNEIITLEKMANKAIADFSNYNQHLDKMTALLSILDDYIGVSNTNMHINAAIGKRAKVLIPHPPEWRWTNNRNSSPWFPGYHIFRQQQNKSWDTAINQLSKEMHKELEHT